MDTQTHSSRAGRPYLVATAHLHTGAYSDVYYAALMNHSNPSAPAACATAAQPPLPNSTPPLESQDAVGEAATPTGGGNAHTVPPQPTQVFVVVKVFRPFAVNVPPADVVWGEDGRAQCSKCGGYCCGQAPPLDPDVAVRRQLAMLEILQRRLQPYPKRLVEYYGAVKATVLDFPAVLGARPAWPQARAPPIAVFECATGGPLHTYIAANSAEVTGSMLMEWFRHAAEGLNCLHEHGIVHQWVEPRHLLVRQEASGAAEVVLGGLGWAETYPTTGGGREGGLQPRQDLRLYGAPELGPGLGRDPALRATPPCDVYSLAASFYVLLTAPVDKLAIAGGVGMVYLHDEFGARDPQRRTRANVLAAEMRVGGEYPKLVDLLRSALGLGSGRAPTPSPPRSAGMSLWTVSRRYAQVSDALVAPSLAVSREAGSRPQRRWADDLNDDRPWYLESHVDSPWSGEESETSGTLRTMSGGASRGSRAGLGLVLGLAGLGLGSEPHPPLWASYRDEGYDDGGGQGVVRGLGDELAAAAEGPDAPSPVARRRAGPPWWHALPSPTGSEAYVFRLKASGSSYPAEEPPPRVQGPNVWRMQANLQRWGLPMRFLALLDAMMATNPGHRPSMGRVLAALDEPVSAPFSAFTQQVEAPQETPQRGTPQTSREEARAAGARPSLESSRQQDESTEEKGDNSEARALG